ncbi:hypothetical protein [Paraflavitalea sp. CAU 1676]|uniref:hypothetical protein n=1 Tax=Paraflavitalea sp. CAU 1676 TaxID=3032598 RepID=UPI0023DC7D15|nr:hypothetical protein [Paraflavitalea sp. CAU 1676]MDF2188688.1 hypothetical protein [Paraflavitalea sp. CAU 1676]
MQLSDNLQEIAQVIRKDWQPVYFGAIPYLDAMSDLQSINDNYGCDSGRSVVNYFLANARTWRGEVAKAVKTKLNELVRQ